LYTRKKGRRGKDSVRNLFKFAIVASVLFIWSCGSMPRTSIYTIDLPVAEKQMNAGAEDPSLAVEVRSPRYLEQPYIASRTSPYALDISRYSKWDLPPDELVAEAVRDTLSKTGRFKEVEVFHNAPGGFHVLDVNLRKFERSDEGGSSYALLSIDVTLTSPEGGELYSEEFSYKEATDGVDFKSLAEKLSASLEDALNKTRTGVLGAVE
jgi:uncharacterized lipoprotein YmbA